MFLPPSSDGGSHGVGAVKVYVVAYGINNGRLLLLLLLLLVGSGAKEEQQRLNLSGTLCRPSIRPITIFHRFSFIQISLLAIFSKPSGLLQILSQ